VIEFLLKQADNLQGKVNKKRKKGLFSYIIKDKALLCKYSYKSMKNT
jgi:hypothetical protein